MTAAAFHRILTQVSPSDVEFTENSESIMSRTLSAFQSHAGEVLKEVLDSGDEDRIFQSLGEEDPDFLKIKIDDFRRHYLCARLALISLVWESVCLDHGIRQHEKAKAFLKKVMDTFQTSETLSFAADFSEYRCAQELSEQPSEFLAIATWFFKRFQLSPLVSMDADAQMLKPSFLILAGALDGLRIGFENQFSDWILSGSAGALS